ncbi:hypothetical protein NQ318_009538 [Aromia moschata]|uniref:Uncharacterized protein n=1 Tax=Aromia moschata TaxID=1265417 RepID=A0AAV8YAZ4_9CUCU|nr:hypothetical protein NQ318_009538 [Aromia moschata]
MVRVNIIQDRVMENKQSQMYKTILQNVILLRAIIQVVQQKGDHNILTSAEAKLSAGLSNSGAIAAPASAGQALVPVCGSVELRDDRNSTNSRVGRELKSLKKYSCDMRAGFYRLPCFPIEYNGGVHRAASAAYSYARGNTPIEKLNNAWEDLQNDANCLVDKESMRSKEGEGLKQIIEKRRALSA